MLKLEKIARTRDLNIILREKQVLLTRTFLVALGYAILIHLGALAIFHVSPFKIGYGESVLPPTTVAAELPILSPNNLSINLEDENPIPAYLIAPGPSMPAFPIAIEHSLFKQMEYIKPRSPLQNPFLSIENNIRIQDFGSLFAGPVHYAPVSINISGSLADKTLIQKKTFEEELAKLASGLPIDERNIPRLFLFSVQIEQRSGEIFWWEAKKVDEDKDLAGLAIQILKTIRFAPSMQDFVSAGEVEIVFIPHI